MNIAFFGWIRVRRIKPTSIFLHEVRLNDRFSLWEHSLDCLRKLLEESDVSQTVDP